VLGYSEGLNLDDIETTTREEVEANLLQVWRWRGPLYELSVNSLMLDYAPDFAKLHRMGSDCFGNPELANQRRLALGVQNLFSYIMQGWETGILNQFHLQRRWGLRKSQIMEEVMFSQIYAGMRGLGHVYHAVGNYLAVMGDAGGPPAPWPDGWAADPAAFKSGLDLTTRSLTSSDVANLTAWYEGTIGYLPGSVQFGIEHHPEFVKVVRAKWERAIKTLPKQVAPYIMLRHHTMTGMREGLREAALLARAWGVTGDWIVLAITGSAYWFTGVEGLYAAFDAVDEIISSGT
jgi:hypothetical protein